MTKTVFGYPQRKSAGFDVNRLQVLLAVLMKRAGMDFSSFDVHVNIVGGLKIKDPANDLAICVALASALKNIAWDPQSVVVGEVGLAGEVRRISHLTERLKEIERLRFARAVIPQQKLHKKTALATMPVTHITEALKNIR